MGVFIGVAAGFLRHRTLAGLANQTLRGERVLVVVLLAQGLAPGLGRFLGLGDGTITSVWVLLSTSLLLLALANTNHPWMLVAAVGLALNIVVVSLNGGMPVELAMIASDRLSTARTALVESPIHVAADQTTALAFLGDRIPIPLGPSRRALVSLGDCVLAAGAMFVAYGMMKDTERS